MDEIRKLLNENAAVSLADAGKVLGLIRGSTYAAAANGDIKTLRLGRLLKVPTAWLREKLDLKESA